MIEYFRPWKLLSLGVGVALLIVGSFYFPAPDWDIPISLIMAFFAYVTAPWSMRILLERHWKFWPAMLFATWFTVDGCYWLYWHFKNPAVLEAMRSANFPASLSLYGLCGLLWFYRGSLRDLISDARQTLRQGAHRLVFEARPTLKWTVVFCSGVSLLFAGALLGIPSFNGRGSVFDVAFSVAIAANAIGLILLVSWARTVTVVLLWVTILVATVGWINPFTASEIAVSGQEIPSVWYMLAVSAAWVLPSLFILHILGKYKSEFGRGLG